MCCEGEKEIIQSFCCWGSAKVLYVLGYIVAKGVCLGYTYYGRFSSSHTISSSCCLVRIRYQGHALAKELAARGLQTTIITDSAVFAMISRVNMVCDYCSIFHFNFLKFSKLILSLTRYSHLKVIVGAHAVMANGGVIAPVGMNMVALAAQRHAVPFVVLAGVHKVFRHHRL